MDKSTCFDRCSQNYFDRPSPLHAIIQSGPLNAKFSGPLRHSQPLSTELENMIAPCVVALLNTSCPATVVWRVTKIVIDAVNAIFAGWTLTHIGVKIFKTFSPAITNRDAAPSISRVGFVVFAIAAIKNACPNGVFGCVCHAMCRVFPCGNFLAQATTTLCVTCSQTLSGVHGPIAAIALAQPLGFSVACCSDKTEHNKSAKTLAAYILYISVWNWNYLWGMITHGIRTSFAATEQVVGTLSRCSRYFFAWLLPVYFSTDRRATKVVAGGISP